VVLEISDEVPGFVQLIAPWLFLVFILSPLGVVISVLEKQKAKLYFDSTMLVARVMVALIGGYIFEDVYMTIYLFSLISSIIWLIWGGYILKIAGIEVKLYWKILAILALIITYSFIKFTILHNKRGVLLKDINFVFTISTIFSLKAGIEFGEGERDFHIRWWIFNAY